MLLSIIVAASNNAAVLPRTLASAEQARDHLRRSDEPAAETGVEIVVVDDGSSDSTPELLSTLTRGKRFYRTLRRPRPSSPSCARNVGTAAAQGDVLLFLDGDDLYLPPHLLACCRILADPAVDFVKTGVRLADPVHPDWQRRIEHSIVLNLAVRRQCHEAVGGFPDYHVACRSSDVLTPVCDVFYKFEDMYYNQLLAALFSGAGAAAATVEYVRYPGNSYDRQYQKFRRPYGAWSEDRSAEERFRLRLCDAVYEYKLEQLRAAGIGRSSARST
jgi:glycosyltransferase involved in cell wall biosynthesis